MMFRDRPFILRERDNWQSPLMLVPSMLMPSDESATDSRDKQVFKDLLERLKNTEALENTQKALTALRRVHHFLERAAHQSLARRLNRASTGARNIAFTDNVNGVTYSAQLLELIRSGDLSDEQMEIVTDFIGFDPRQRSEYSLFFANDNVPGTLVPGLPSAARDEMVEKGFLSAGTIFEEFDDSPALVSLVAFDEDGTISGNVNAVIESLKDMYGDDIMLTHSLVAYAEKVDLSDRSMDDIGALGYDEEKNGREALVALMEKYIKQWSISANDADPVSLAIQDIAEEEFGIEGAYPFGQFYDDSIFPLDVMEDLVAQVRQRQGEAIRLAIRAQYKATQEFLRKQGIEFLGIIRGFTMPESHPLYPDVIDVSETSIDADLEATGIDGEHSLRPLSSWSTNTPTAIAFSKNTAQLDEDRKSVVVVARVPREQIFGTALSGNGCLDEYEVVLLGVPTNGRTYPADAARILDRDQTVPEGEGGLDTEWLNLDVPSPRIRSADYSSPEEINIESVNQSARQVIDTTEAPNRPSRSSTDALSRVVEVLTPVDPEADDIPFSFEFEINDDDEMVILREGPIEERQSGGIDWREIGESIRSALSMTVTSRSGSAFTTRPNRLSVGRRAIMVEGAILDEDERVVGTFSRGFFISQTDGKLTAYHDVLRLNASIQREGVATAFNATLEQMYRNAGIEKIVLDASSSPGISADQDWVGAAVWPKAGYDWATENSMNKMLDSMRDFFSPLLGLDEDELRSRKPELLGDFYVEGLSDGPAPTADERREIAYFGSIDEYISFILTLNQAQRQDFLDDNRVVAGDLVRWAGAGNWTAGQRYVLPLSKDL